MDVKLKTVMIVECSRCGETHTSLLVKAFDNPAPDEHTHWVVCPKKGQPVMFTIATPVPAVAARLLPEPIEMPGLNQARRS